MKMKIKGQRSTCSCCRVGRLGAFGLKHSADAGCVCVCVWLAMIPSSSGYSVRTRAVLLYNQPPVFT